MKFETDFFPTVLQRDDLQMTRRQLKRFDDRTDEYFVYKLEEEEVVFNWVDKWFHDKFDNLSPDRYYTSIWTIKMVDVETSQHLYNRLYNPFRISVMRQYKDPLKYSIKAQMHSVDDSSYGAWFNGLADLTEVDRIVNEVVDYIDGLKVFNGQNFVNFVTALGCKDIDYN